MTNEKNLTHIDLFSGIGGFTLAGEWAGFRTVAFCEKEEFCQKVLKKRFRAIAHTDNRRHTRSLRETVSRGQDKAIPNPELSGRDSRGNSIFKPLLIPEIRDFDGTKYRGATLLTGGFPCQPFSTAGQRRGKEDDHYLWPEMLRVINEAKPHWILAENVPGIFRMALDTVLADLESEGYTTGTFIIPACGLNAPHRRNRVWIVANARKQERDWLSGIGRQEMVKIGRGNQDARNTGGKGLQGNSGKLERTETIPPRPDSHASDSTSKRKKSISQQGQRSGIKSSDSHAPDSDSKYSQEFIPRNKLRYKRKEETPRWGIHETNWQEDWYEVATRFCRVDDGVSDRIHRLKALGNAIVPQVAYEILKNIAWIEKELHGN